MFNDLVYIYLFWLILFIIGLTALPLTLILFRKFVDKGYIFAKILGIVLLSYFVWLLSSLRILAFSQTSIIVVALVIALFNLGLFFKFKNKLPPLRFSHLKLFLFEELLFLTGILMWSLIRGYEPSIHGLEKFMDFGFINSILRTRFMPPMDMWLAPEGPVLSTAEGLAQSSYTGGFTINYYYFGHYVTALLTKISTILPEITYNIMLGVLYAFTFTGSFSIALNLFAVFQRQTGFFNKQRVTQGGGTPDSAQLGSRLQSQGTSTGGGEAERQDPLPSYNKRTVACALLAGFLVALGGNLHTIYAFTKGYPLETPQPFWQVLGKPNINAYWYPNATRFIPNTIHEFPIYSFVVSDLHGHVLDIPFVLLTIAFLFSILLSYKSTIPEELKMKNEKVKITIKNSKLIDYFNLFQISNFKFQIILLGLLLAVMYMTNAWDGIIYFGLAGLVLLVVNTSLSNFNQSQPRIKNYLPVRQAGELRIMNFKISLNLLSLILNSCFLILSFIVFSLPFNRNFIPFAKGIGINCITPNATNQVLCDHSPIWMMAVLWGYFFYFAVSFLIWIILPALKLLFNPPFDSAQGKQLITKSDIFVTLLIIISTGLLIAPEFIFARDIYPAHYRANTMFKLGYQAFMMLGICVSYIFFRFLTISPFAPLSKAVSFSKLIVIKLSRSLWWSLAFIQLFLVAIYPLFAVNSYYNGLRQYHTLDGLDWLSQTYPGDYAAVNYLRETIPSTEQPTILEAVGESYTDYARISANTGLPTVIGWPVHEWLWRGTYDEAGKRQEEVRRIYEAQDPGEAKILLQKYNVQYVVVGSQEIEKYPNLNEQIFTELGKPVFIKGATRIYKLNPF